MLRKLARRVTNAFGRDRQERALDRELQFHLDMLTEQHVQAGMAPDDARRAALRAFGEIDRIKDEVRDTWMSRLLETLAQDVRYGIRNLRRTPGFAVVVVLTMALGIGANTAIFSVVNGVLLRPLPHRDGDRLVVLRQQQPLAGVNDMRFSVKEIADYRARAKSIEDIVEFHDMWFILLGRPEPERVSTGVVSASFFEVLGVRPLYGRSFVAADDRPGADAVLVLSHKYWQRSFGGDPSVVGRVFEMNDRPHQVIGILPPIPEYPVEVDVYMPTSACPFRSDPEMVAARDARMMRAFARVRPGVTIEKAGADLAVVAAGMQQDHPESYPAHHGLSVSATPLQEEMTRAFRTTLFVLLGTAGFVLLIVCASVANLMLARMVQREREMAVRAALGASRTRLLRQLLTESLLLSALGGLLGLAIAGWGIDLLVAFAARFTPRAGEVAIDRTVLLYTLAVSVATGLLFGCVPALAGRLSISPTLRDGSRATHGSQGIRSALVVVQVAVSFMLLIGAGLTLRSLFELHRVDPGFRTEDVLTLRIDLNFSKYIDPFGERVPFWERLEDALRALPGAVTVAGAGTFPLNDQGPFSAPIQIQGRDLPGGAARPRVDARMVTPDYFRTLQQPLVKGRAFTRTDRGPENLVVIINETMARHYWPGDDPIGRKISGNTGRTWSTIVGVVADARQQLNTAPTDELYLPLFQSGQLSSNWLVRTSVEPAVMARQVREAVRAIDPDQPVDHFRTLADVRSASLQPPRLTAALLGLFAVLALIVTATGMAGIVAFSVNQRTQEFGVRMALGARRGSVLALVLGQGLQLVLVGLAVGMAGALVLTRVIATLLFGIEPTDALTFLAVSMVLVAVAAAACLIPARRAASVDPMVALRVG